MATSKKKLNKIDQIVTDHFLNGVDESATMMALMGEKVEYSELASTVQSTGEKLGLYLSAKDITEKVAADLKGKDKPAHFFDLCDMVKELDIPQASFTALLVASQLALKTNLSKSRRYVSLKKGDGVSTYARIGKWALENPNFTPSEMAAQDFGINDPLYVDDFLSYQKFFKELEELKAMEG